MINKSVDAFRTISEVAEDMDLPQHVLRFWETKFTQIKPLKRGGGRRYYRPEDIDLVRGIRYLLYSQGYTIKGVQRIIKEQGVKTVMAVWKSSGDGAVNVHIMPPLVDMNAPHNDHNDEFHPLDSTAQVSEELIAALETYDLEDEEAPVEPSPPYHQRSDVSIMRGGLTATSRLQSAKGVEANHRMTQGTRDISSSKSDSHIEKGTLVLSALDRTVLMGALQDLAECRRILDAASQP